MKFVNEEEEKRFNESQRPVNEQDILATVSIEELQAELDAQKKLMNERSKAIRDAYKQLPPAHKMQDGTVYYVPYKPVNKGLVLVTKDFVPDTHDEYKFELANGRWIMTESEYNRHIYKGLIL